MIDNYPDDKMSAERQVRELATKSIGQMHSAMISFFIGGGTLLAWIGMKLMDMNGMWEEAPSTSVYVVMGVGVVITLIVGSSYYSNSKATMDEEYSIRNRYGLD